MNQNYFRELDTDYILGGAILITYSAMTDSVHTHVQLRQNVFSHMH